MMFSIGDTVIYGMHGVCVIKGIEEQKIKGEIKKYYVLQSYHDTSLKLFYPVDMKDSVLVPTASKSEAKMTLDVFKETPNEWDEHTTARVQGFQRILKSNAPIEIAQMVKYDYEEKICIRGRG